MNQDNGKDGLNQGGPLQASVGARLKAARAERGVSLAEIAKATRVPQRHLQSLENDSHDKLPALPYTVGFVKSFAKSVGLPPEEVAAQYRAENGATSWTPQLTHFEPVDDRRVPPRGALLAALGALLLLLLLTVGYAMGWFDSEPAQAPAPVEEAVPAYAPTQEAAPAQPLEPAAPAPTAPAQMPATDSLAPAAAPGGALTPAAAAAQGPVVIRATADAWIKVSADFGRTTVKMGILRAGEQYQLPNMEGLTLWTGKAGALEVRVGGKVVPPLGALEQTVRNVSLAPADLLARTN